MQQPSCCLLLLHARLGDMPLAALRGTSACVGCKSTQCKGHQRITFPDKLGDGGVLTGRSSFLCMGLGSVSTVWNSGYHPCFIASDVGRSSAQRGATPLQEAEILAATVMERRAASRVEIKTLKGCGLGIARYPDFVYNAEGGGGSGTVEELEDGRLAVEFNAEKLYIPAIGFGNTTFLGLPLPPFIRIDVVPQILRGFIERKTGKIELEFSAEFFFSVGSLYQPPPLLVDTLLTTEKAQGQLRSGHGHRLDSAGFCELVGVAPLVQIDDAFMNSFLMLPTDCLAAMSAKLTFF
eukprot:c20506_g1_i2 orf=101-982(+)